MIYVDSPSKLPAVNDIEVVGEPIARCNIWYRVNTWVT